jgi:hypothetical protein
MKVRVKELHRIDQDNDSIKERLVSQTTHYPAYRFDNAAIEQERLKRNILFNSSKTIISPWQSVFL